MSEPTHAKIPFPLLNTTMAYLAKRPWDEVANLMAALHQAAEATLKEAENEKHSRPRTRSAKRPQLPSGAPVERSQ
jgi:hypothetical protein